MIGFFSRWKNADWSKPFHPAPEVSDVAPWDPPLHHIPTNRAEVYEVFGDPGTVRIDRAFERKNLVVARDLPGDWNKNRGRLYVHRKAEPYVREVLARLERARLLVEIEKIGCFNFRHMRHNPRLPLSLHSWAIALDINPADNAAHYFKRGDRPEAFSEGWWGIWPTGLSEEIVFCFEEVGWKWGGRWKTFVDPMHFQLCG